MTVDTWLRQATEQLATSGDPTARLDALVLLEDCLKQDRAYLLAHNEREIEPAQLDSLTEQLKRRQADEPLAYIRGKTEFYGRLFVVTAAVLEPRPESETMIDQLKHLPIGPTPRILDVGTGSGALGITAALELPGARVTLTDISAGALAVAERNMAEHLLTLTCQQADLFDDTAVAYDVLLCNLPYVPTDFPINPAAQYEPRLAIFGGHDGLDLYRRLFGQATTAPQPPRYILTEALPEQHDKLRAIAATSGYEVSAQDDFIQVFQLRTAG